MRERTVGVVGADGDVKFGFLNEWIEQEETTTERDEWMDTRSSIMIMDAMQCQCGGGCRCVHSCVCVGLDSVRERASCAVSLVCLNEVWDMGCRVWKMRCDVDAVV